MGILFIFVVIVGIISVIGSANGGKALICLIGVIICMALASTGIGAIVGIPILWCIAKAFSKGIK